MVSREKVGTFSIKGTNLKVSVTERRQPKRVKRRAGSGGEKRGKEGIGAEGVGYQEEWATYRTGVGSRSHICQGTRGGTGRGSGRRRVQMGKGQDHCEFLRKWDERRRTPAIGIVHQKPTCAAWSKGRGVEEPSERRLWEEEGGPERFGYGRGGQGQSGGGVSYCFKGPL